MPRLLPRLTATVGLASSLAAAWPVQSPDTTLTQLRPGTVRELATGKILVAARGLPDPNFSQTVVLLADYSDEGTMGIVLNRRTEMPIARVFPNLTDGLVTAALLYAGGPVAPDGVVALERSRAKGRNILDDVRLVSERADLERLITSSAGPDRLRVYLGYAGWGPGQLERETLLGSWHVFSAEAATVFDAQPDTLWQRQIGRTEQRMATLLAIPRPDRWSRHATPAGTRQAARR